MAIRMIAGIGVTLLAASPVATAQDSCAGLADWRHPAALTAAADARGLTAASLRPGQAVLVRLAPAAALHVPAASGTRTATQGYGGMLIFDVPAAGTYRVMLGGHAWIDVVRGGAAIASTHHQPGPSCGPVRKMVDFPLQAGRQVIELGGSDVPQLALMVALAP